MNEDNIFSSRVIHENFFKYLDSKSISQKQYAEDHNLDRSLISKWRSGQANMTVEQVYRAAEYLDVTVNDLFYSEKQKTKIHLFNDKSFAPIKAQRILKQRILDEAFSKPQIAIIAVVLINLVIGVLSLMLVNQYDIWMILIVLLGSLGWYAAKSVSESNRTYIVNYIDEIYYSRKDTKASKKLFFSLLIIIGFVLIVTQILLVGNYTEINAVVSLLVAIYALVLLAQFLVSIIFLIMIPKKLPSVLYAYEADGFTISRVLMSLVIYQSTICSLIIYLSSTLDYYFIAIQVVLLGLYVLIYLLVAKEYSMYVLTYDEFGKEPRPLPIYRDE